MPTPQDVWKKGSKILKLPPVHNCFTLAMTSKLVVIINSLKVPEIKKILLYEMKFLVPNYSCLQNPWLGGNHTQIPVLSVLCPQLNLLNPSQTKFLGMPLLWSFMTVWTAHPVPQFHIPEDNNLQHVTFVQSTATEVTVLYQIYLRQRTMCNIFVL